MHMAASWHARREGSVFGNQNLVQELYRHHNRSWQNPALNMSLAAFYLHKVDECVRLADDARDPCDHDRFVSERCEWLRVLADEIGADVGVVEATIALLPS
jgi:hypothetical protein